jgi:transcriptional regulator with XRE-family HTH domain
MNATEQLIERARARHSLPPPPVRRAVREQAGITRAEIAEALGVTRPMVTRYESGEREPRSERREVYAELLARLARETAT